MATRQDIQDEARKLIGIPWHHQGRNAETGIDCIGCIIHVALKLGIFSEEKVKEIDSVDYSRIPSAYNLLLQRMKENLIEIPISEAKEGDILTFRLPHEKLTSHVAFLLRGEREYTLVHALEKKLTTEEAYQRWKRCVTGAFRFQNVD